MTIAIRGLLLAGLVACGGRAHPTPKPNAEVHGAWSAPVEPFRVAGSIYYVGAQLIASYLIATPDGHILLDSGTREMVPLVRRNIEQLGFAVRDIKIVLCSHAHFDHVQGHAAIVRASGARVMVMRGDAEAVAAGVDRSPAAGEGWDPVPVDRVLEDGDTVALGGTTLRAVAAPGHTPGCTVWTTRVRERERDFTIAFYGCSRPNDGVRLINNPRFPHLIEDTQATFRKLRALAPDVYVTMHPDDLAAIHAERIVPDPAAWPKVLDEAEAELAAQLRKARGA